MSVSLSRMAMSSWLCRRLASTMQGEGESLGVPPPSDKDLDLDKGDRKALGPSLLSVVAAAPTIPGRLLLVEGVASMMAKSLSTSDILDRSSMLAALLAAVTWASVAAHSGGLCILNAARTHSIATKNIGLFLADPCIRQAVVGAQGQQRQDQDV